MSNTDHIHPSSVTPTHLRAVTDHDLLISLDLKVAGIAHSLRDLQRQTDFRFKCVEANTGYARRLLTRLLAYITRPNPKPHPAPNPQPCDHL